MTIVYTYLAADNSRNRRKARRKANRELERSAEQHLHDRVSKACIELPLRSPTPSSSATCLPDTAQYVIKTVKKSSRQITAR